MDPIRDAGILVSAVAAVASVAGMVVNLKVRAEVADLRVEMERARREDGDKMREWVEGRLAQREGWV